MGATKEYFLKLREEAYNELPDIEKLNLSRLGLEVRQIPSEEDLNDEKVKLYKREIAKNYENLDKYLFEKRNK
jgi:hypothetical protein